MSQYMMSICAQENHIILTIHMWEQDSIPQKTRATRTPALDQTIIGPPPWEWEKKANHFWDQSQEYPDPIIPGSGNQFANLFFSVLTTILPTYQDGALYAPPYTVHYDLRFTRCDMWWLWTIPNQWKPIQNHNSTSALVPNSSTK